MFEQKVANIVEHPKRPQQTTDRAITYFKEKKPDFTFVHLDYVDGAGHDHRHGTP